MHARPKAVVSVLRRGDAFGDQAILAGEAHSVAAVPRSNTTLLVVDREVSLTQAGVVVLSNASSSEEGVTWAECVCVQDFLSVLGPHFRDAAAARQRFLLHAVAPLTDLEPEAVRVRPRAHKSSGGRQCGMRGALSRRISDPSPRCCARPSGAAAVRRAHPQRRACWPGVQLIGGTGQHHQGGWASQPPRLPCSMQACWCLVAS